MNLLFWIAQACGIIGLVLCVIGLQFKKKDKVVLFYLFANIFITAEYFLLEAWVGGAINAVCIVRNIVFYFYSKKDKRSPVWVLVLIEAALVACGIVGWANWWSLIPIVVGAVYTYGNWQENVLVLKITAAISASGWLVYSAVVRAYVSVAQEVIILVSAIVAICILLANAHKEKLLAKSQAQEAPEKTQTSNVSADNKNKNVA